MRKLNQAETLALWEKGYNQHALDKGVLAVATAFPEQRDAVADWPLGRRNRALSELHASMFGARLNGWTQCRQCSAQLEFQLDLISLLKTADDPGEERIAVGGRRLRLPTSRDLAAIANDPAHAIEQLLDRCADQGEGGKWTEEEIEEVEERFAAADPLAEILLHFDCPDCGASFDESLELAAFLWAELETRAMRTLRDVHVLAAAYGWSEGEILSLTPARRQMYVEMVRA